MYHGFIFILFKLNLLQPSKRHMAYWIKNGDTNKLEYALKKGNYKTREYAAKGLEIVGNSTSAPVLLNAIYDPIHKVSMAALNALETLDPNNELITTITNRRLNWFKHYSDKERMESKKVKKKYTIYRWERTSKKNFEMIKERLKRPIR